MSGPASASSAPLPFCEYDSGAAYPPLTNLPPLSNGAPSAKSGMSTKAQALRERLANAENDFDAGEDSNEPLGLDTKLSKKPHNLASKADGAVSSASQESHSAHPVMQQQVNPVSQLPQLPHLQQRAVPLQEVQPMGTEAVEPHAHAYAPPGWHAAAARAQQNGQQPILPPLAHRAQQQSISSEVEYADPQIRKIVELLEARARIAGGGSSSIAGGGPDTTTEDLISLAFVGMFFMLALHALAPPVVYRR